MIVGRTRYDNYPLTSLSFSGQDSETFLDQARCMAHVTHAYHLRHENLKTLMTALKQLNTVEEAQEDIHEV